MHKGQKLIKCLRKALNDILMPQAGVELRVNDANKNVAAATEQEDPLPITRISNAPAIMQTRDPMVKQNLIKTTRTHCRQTRNNTPVAVPVIQRVAPTLILPEAGPTTEKQCSQRIRTKTSPTIILPPSPVPGGIRASVRLVSQQALSALTTREAIHPPEAFTLRHFVQKLYKDGIPNYAHFALPMVHLTMGKMITSYKQLMSDPEMAQVWQAAFGKDFGGLAQGDKKTGQKGTNSVFVMTHKEIDIAMVAGHHTNGLTPKLSSIITHKRRILIESALPLAATS